MSTEEKTEKIYAEIGRFSVEFEQICHTMEGGIRTILDLEGLKNEQIQEILLAGFTAESLSSLYRSLSAEYLKPSKVEEEIIAHIFSCFQKLISDRNYLIHGKWFLASKLVNDCYEAVAFGKKLHKNSKGAATKEVEYSIENFRALCVQARKCLSHISKFTNCIAGGYPLEKNFNKLSKGVYEPVAGLCIK